MKIYLKETVTREIETLNKVICDFCKKELTDDPQIVENCEVSCETGTVLYGAEGGENEKYTFDICSKCFIEKFSKT